jgi:hypothetical protein
VGFVGFVVPRKATPAAPLPHRKNIWRRPSSLLFWNYGT